jgi:probable F420-dependent oxidoreductase
VHPFRFGVMVTRAASAEAWVAVARRAEELGYDILLMPDHLGGQLSPIGALAAAAAATTRLRIGSYVFANDYRHPLVLAREAATLDLLSGGRFELGIGAGWNVADYRKLGLAYDPPPRRIDRLTEAVPLLKRLLAGEVVNHAGAHYRLDRAHIGPLPLQRPRPPLLIGGGGPRMLRLAAREADIVALQPQFNPQGRPMVRQATEGATERKIAILRDAAGPRFEQLELNVIVGDAGLVGSGRPAGESLVAATKSLASGLVRTPYVLYGTLGQLRDGLRRRRDRLGISYYAIPGGAMESMAPLVAALRGT